MRRPRPHAGAFTLLLVVAALLLWAGCGEGGDEAAAGGETVTVRGGDSIAVVATEYAFDPSTIVIEPAARPVELTLDNRGSLAHNLVVYRGEEEVAASETIEGGATDAIEIDLQPGTYRLVCTVANHEELGMVGELRVG